MAKSKRLWLVPLMVLFLLVFQQFASGICRFVANLFSYDRIDPYNIFAWFSVHHIVQMILALVAVAILTKTKNLISDFV